MGKSVTLMVTHILSEDIFLRYKKLKDGFRKYGETYLLYQLDGDESHMEFPDYVDAIPFSIVDLCSLPYRAIAESIAPGSNHFILLWFFLNHPDYDYYWNVEYDVVFDGEWSMFFDSVQNLTAGMITCHISAFSDEPTWYWWKTLKSEGCYIPLFERIRSFNPIYRMSADGLKILDNHLSNGWGGHHETVIPTIMKINGIEMMDLGAGYKDKISGGLFFYVTDKFLPYGSMRHKPEFKKDEIPGNSNLLFHPVK